MNSCNKILILGGGISAERFVISYMFDSTKELTICGFNILGQSKKLAEKYCLNYIEYEKLNKNFVSNFDVIIFSLPPKAKLKYLKKVILDLEYKKYIILEKPLSLEESEIAEYEKLLKNVEGFNIAYTRNFLDDYKLKDEKEYNIVCGSVSIDMDFNITNNLPHLLDLFYLSFNKMPTEFFLKKFALCGTIESTPINIRFETQIDNLIVNNYYYPKINFVLANNRMLEKFNKGQDYNFKKDLQIIQIIKNLRGKINEEF